MVVFEKRQCYPQIFREDMPFSTDAFENISNELRLLSGLARACSFCWETRGSEHVIFLPI